MTTAMLASLGIGLQRVDVYAETHKKKLSPELACVLHVALSKFDEKNTKKNTKKGLHRG
jgi:hypothetical protein